MYIINGTPQYSVLLQNKENILFKSRSLRIFPICGFRRFVIGYSL